MKNNWSALEELKYLGETEFSRPRFWLFPSNLQYYNVYGAFEQYNEIYWRQNLNNINVDDRVFIYIGAPESKLSFYCEVLEVNVNQEQAIKIDDSKFWLVKDESIQDRYVKLKLLKRIYDNRFNLEKLNENGIRGNIQSQQEIKGTALEFILNELNHRYLDLKEIGEALELFKLIHLDKDKVDLKICENERMKFIRRFPVDKIGQITLKDYCLGLDTYDNFCYYLETKLKASGSIKGGSANKFGLFYSRGDNRYKIVPKWSLTNNENEALEKIKKSICEVIKAGDAYDFFTLENNELAPIFKGKILATYYPSKYMGIFGNEDFDYFFYRLSVPFNSKLSPVRKQYQLLKLKQENNIFDSLTLDEFMKFLYAMFGQELLAKKKEDNKRNFKKSENRQQEEPDDRNGKQRLIKEDFEFVGNSKATKTVKRKGPIDFESLQKKRTSIGFKGEMLVMDYETELLHNCGSKHRPKHIALTDPSAGYDIISYDEIGKIKYIEVKTRKVRTPTKLDFFITANEREKFETLEGYVIYFVSDLNSSTPKLRIVTKEIYDKLEFEPIAFHVKADINVIG